MTIINKIFLYAFIWVIAAGLMAFYAVPKINDSLITLQNSHQDQLNQLNILNAQASSLHQMQTDLTQVKTEVVQPQNFFTSDVNLVNEFKYIEKIAQFTNTTLELSITGTSDAALPVKVSRSGLLEIPYSIKVQGSFPATVSFIKNLENSYFISPINGLTFAKTDTGLSTTIQSNTFLNK